MRRLSLVPAVLALALGTGCISFRIGSDAEPPEFQMKGWGNAFATIGEIPDYEGSIVSAHLFRGGKHTGEIAAIDIWPVLGLNVGVLGLSGRLFNLEAGAGTLFYRPSATTEWGADAEAEIDD